jgi:hypothetical protein
MAMPPARAAPAFAPTEKLTVPLPEPLLPEVTEIQAAVLAAVHAHPAGAPTVTAPEAPAGGRLWLPGVSVTMQLAAI